LESPEAPDTPIHGARAINADVAVGEAEAFYPSEEFVLPTPRVGQGGRIARSTAFFSAATALSRIAGLAREIAAAGYFGVKGPVSAFTIAFQVPNLIRSLFADAALSAAFVPVFTELLEQGKRREAFRLAGNRGPFGEKGLLCLIDSAPILQVLVWSRSRHPCFGLDDSLDAPVFGELKAVDADGSQVPLPRDGDVVIEGIPLALEFYH